MTSRLWLARVGGVLGVALACVPAPGSAQVRQGRGRDPALARTRVLKSWDDTIKEDGRDIARHVNITFDYRAGVAWEQVVGPILEPFGNWTAGAPARGKKGPR